MVQKRGQGTGSGQGCGCGPGSAGKGAQGTCACSVCGHEVPHQPGVPCRDRKCPQCGGVMIRRV